jgi:enediyne biosynthesis protein E4
MIDWEPMRRPLVIAAALGMAIVATMAMLVLRGPNNVAVGSGPVSQPVASVTPLESSNSHLDGMPPVRISPAMQFTDVSAQTGIRFRHQDGGSGEKYLIEPATGGVALFDYDGDGLIDIYFVSGRPLPPASPDPQAVNALYRNEGNWRFRDVTHSAGVAGTEYALGVVVGDYDNDGDPDLFVNNFGPNTLYRNNGDGTFSDATAVACAAGRNRVGAGASFLDMDADGDLDLFVANYVAFELSQNHPRRNVNGFPVYPGPLDYDAAPNVLLENLGDGTFCDITESSGVGRAAGSGMATLCIDYDQDGDTDVLVANDQRGNFLFDNDGHGKFTEVGVLRGFAYNLDGSPRANMGLDCSDFDGDGWLDVISSTYQNELPVLYRNDRGSFEDVSRRCGDLMKAVTHVKWGVGFGDFDSDCYPDLFIACGDLEPEVHRWKPSTAFRVPNVLLRNLGHGTFRDISASCGDGLTPVESSRGAGVDDLDNDGNLDLVVLNTGSQPTIIRNETKTANHWLQLDLRGTTASRDAIGAQVRVTARGRTFLAEAISGRGYQSHFGSRLHFGLGDSDHAERVEIRWLGGGQDVFTNVSANQRLRVIQGSSVPFALMP